MRSGPFRHLSAGGNAQWAAEPQWLKALALFWQESSRSTTPESERSLSVLSGRALAAASLAACYILTTSPITGVAALDRERPPSEVEVRKAVFDVAIGQSIGASFTPLFSGLFDALCRLGLALEQAWGQAAGPGKEAGIAYEARRRQDWELAAACAYTVAITPLTAWLYHLLVFVPNERRSEGQNASAAAGAEGGGEGGGGGAGGGGGDAGGDDGGGDGGGDGGDGGD